MQWAAGDDEDAILSRMHMPQGLQATQTAAGCNGVYRFDDDDAAIICEVSSVRLGM